ncbi:MAG: TetR/AcrR family transcriptional regulator [Clostridiales bacterium]|nr:TetR/AcrR family transcriptional regulator [Clostridiales bacterium]MCF8023456.1 TetR/AcrR family transcriptional regulator [Clostridiales bacterium]
MTNIDKRILNSMEKLAHKKGFAAATTDELASEAGISKRTLYRYFTSKEEIIENVIYRLTGRIETEVNQIEKSSLTPVEKLHYIVVIVKKNLDTIEFYGLEELQKNYPHIWNYIEEFRASRIEHFENILKEGIEKGDFKPVNTSLTVTALLASVKAVINPSFISSHSLSLEEAFNNLLDMFLHGIIKKE